MKTLLATRRKRRGITPIAIKKLMLSKQLVSTLGLLIVCNSFALLHAESMRVPGITEPLRDADISASVAGKIAKIHFQEGDAVKIGGTIITLHDELESLEVSRRQLMFNSKAELEAAIARMETLKVDYDSTRALFEKTKSVSQDELNRKHLEYKIAAAEKIKEENEEKREEIELRMAEFQLAQRQITAPFDGIIAEIYLEEGEDCEPNRRIFRLVDLSQCNFICNVEAHAAIYLSPGQEVDIELNTGTNPIKRVGIVEFIAPTIDPASGLRKVKVLVDNPDGTLTPGVTGSLIISTRIAIK